MRMVKEHSQFDLLMPCANFTNTPQSSTFPTSAQSKHDTTFLHAMNNYKSIVRHSDLIPNVSLPLGIRKSKMI